MSWVDYTRDDRWSMTDLKAKARNVLALEFDDAQDLQVKAAQLASGNGFMTADERLRWDALMARRSELETQVGTEWISMQRLAAAMDVEALQLAFYALPPPPDPPEPDPHAQERQDLQAGINGAAPEVTILVTARARVQPPAPPEQEVTP